jgi:hypothetical protein
VVPVLAVPVLAVLNPTNRRLAGVWNLGQHTLFSVTALLFSDEDFQRVIQ